MANTPDRPDPEPTPDSPDFLRTDDWLKITPQSGGPPVPPADPDAIDPLAETSQLLPPMFVKDGGDSSRPPGAPTDDAILLADDLLPGPPSGVVGVGGPASDPDQPASKLFAGAEPVTLPDLPPAAADDHPPPAAALERQRAEADQPRSDADIALPPPPVEDASDIFSTARRDGSNLFGSGATGGSGLFTGAAAPPTGGESHVFADRPTGGGESDLFAAYPEPDRGSNVFGDPSGPAGPDRSDDGAVAFDAAPAGPATERTMSGSRDDDDDAADFDEVSTDPSGSNVLGEATVMDFDLGAHGPTSSGVNLGNPEADQPSATDPASSIFGRGPGDQPSDPGRVDLDQIPLMASSDERTDAVLDLDEDDHDPTSVFGPTAAGGLPAGDSDADSGRIEWGRSAAGQQPSTRGPAPDDSAEELLPPAAGGADAVALGAAAGQPSGRSRAIPRLPGHSDPGESSIIPEFSRRPQPRSRGLLAGALGLAAGVGLGAGGMYFAGGGTTGGTATGAGPVPVAQQPAAPGGLAGAKSLLAAGDPATALAAFEQAGDSPEALAGRGQARWMARARQAAAAGERLAPTDPAMAKAAEELQAAVAAQATTPEEQQAVAKAALHLGLIKEAVGQPAEAQKIYADAAAKLPPQFRKWFTSARERVDVMRKNADGTPAKEFSRLPADDAERLGAMAVVLLDLAPVQETEDEAGFHFWEAINHAANWQTPGAFDRAIAAINTARKVHDDRRRKLVGMGLNPVSDPREQMFLRACDELRFYWAFKKAVYADPTGMDLAKKGGTGGAIAEMLKATKAYAAVEPKLKAADAAVAQAKKAGEELAAAKEAERAAAEVARKAEDENRKLAADVAAAKKAVDARATELTTARGEAAAAAAKLKAADAALDPIIDKLKAAKLIDESADRPAALAALPAATRKAVVTTGGGTEAADLARQLADARDQLKAARDDADRKVAAAEAKLTAATADAERRAKDVAAAAEKASAAGKADLERKLAAARAEAEQRQAMLDAERQRANAERAEAARQFEAKLTAQAEQFRSQLAAARAGAVVPLADLDQVAADRAASAYGAGVEAYFAGRYSDAERLFAAAAKADPADARVWYFLGLAKWVTGRQQEAAADFQKGADLEARGRPGRREVGAALERVQGAARAAVDAYRP